MRVAFFTAGTKGAGHLVRGLAIERALRRAGFRGAYRMFGPAQRFPAAASATNAFHEVTIDERELLSAARARGSELARVLMAFAPDVLVVDMFWAPLRHVLPIARCEAWLLLRAMHPRWLAGPPGHPFDPAQYARIIGIEPAARAPAVGEHIDPIVIANRDEQRPAGALYERLSLARDRRIVAVVHAGVAGESRLFTPAVKRDEVLVELDLHAPDAMFPAAEWMTDCQAIHAAAGYNAFWEAHWLGYASRTTFVPFARTNDDSHARLAWLGHAPRTNGADVLAARLVAPAGG